MPTRNRLPSPESISKSLTAWFGEHARDYPWRRTRDPYAILVSEVMLQQTQITTVLSRGYYSRWMEQFPDFQTLAVADETRVLKAWEGLGYYRRARNLQKLARVIVEKHDGVFPEHHEQMLDLPGIGPYTAGAVASFAFGQPRPVVDGNVARVLSRVYNHASPVDSTAGVRWLWHHAEALVQATDDPRSLNSALMELGQTHCTPTKPACQLCPLEHFCQATEPESLPVKEKRQEFTDVTERVVFLRNEHGVLLEQETGSRRTGLWKLPALPASLAENPPPVLMRTRYGITRFRVTLWVHEVLGIMPDWPETHRIIALQELGATPMPSPYRRALRDLLKQEDFKLEA